MSQFAEFSIFPLFDPQHSKKLSIICKFKSLDIFFFIHYEKVHDLHTQVAIGMMTDLSRKNDIFLISNGETLQSNSM